VLKNQVGNLNMDNIGDLFGKLIAAGKQKKVCALVFKSDVVLQILDILYKEGLISSFEDKGYYYNIFLKYYGEFPLIRECKRYSTFSKKVYYTVPVLVKEFRRSDFVILSTVYGIILKDKALDFNVGGEVLVKIN
jgi:ribosomal protein S8